MNRIKARNKTHAARLRSARARRRRLVAAGLRSDGQPRAARKPCGCFRGHCLHCMNDSDSRYHTAEKVARMHADYLGGMSFAAVERKYGVGTKGLKSIFQRRGLELRPLTMRLAERDPLTGQVKPMKRKGWAEVRALLQGRRRVSCPPELAQQWRTSPMSWRRKLVAMIWCVVNPPYARPRTPFSTNVTPFEYGTPQAMQILAELNRGRDSRTKVCSIRISSQGVIYDGKLWFWCRHWWGESGCGYLSSKAHHLERHATGRMLLHHYIWEQHNGALPARHTVIFKDGNRNNFTPANLALRSMADCARMNSIPARLARDPHNPELQEKMRRRGERIWATRNVNKINRARQQTAALVQSLQNNSGGLLAALNRRNESCPSAQ